MTPAQEAVDRAHEMALLAAIEAGSPEDIADAALAEAFTYVEECAGTMSPDDFGYELRALIEACHGQVDPHA